MILIINISPFSLLSTLFVYSSLSPLFKPILQIFLSIANGVYWIWTTCKSYFPHLTYLGCYDGVNPEVEAPPFIGWLETDYNANTVLIKYSSVNAKSFSHHDCVYISKLLIFLLYSHTSAQMIYHLSTHWTEATIVIYCTDSQTHRLTVLLIINSYLCYNDWFSNSQPQLCLRVQNIFKWYPALAIY